MQAFIGFDSSRRDSEDRGEIFQVTDGLCLAIADGAGGISGGAEAANLFIEVVRQAASSLDSRGGLAGLMMGVDGRISEDALAGETTGIIVSLREGKLVGASVGDSAAWLFTESSRCELTSGQMRKPLIGSGSVTPHLMSMDKPIGTLVIATDGLWKYTSLEAIHKTVLENAMQSLPVKLINLARLKSGTLPDDVCVIVCSLP